MDDNFLKRNYKFTEDISSTSRRQRIVKVKSFFNSSNAIVLKLGKIIKIISFFIGLSIMGGSCLLAYLLYSSDTTFKIICSAIVIIGTISAGILMLITFSIGHILDQNNEIIKQLENNNDGE